MTTQMRKRNLQSDNDSRRSSIASVDTESSSSSSQVSEPREIPSLEALNHIEKELKKIKKETQKKLDVFNIVPKAWLSFHKSRDLSQEQAVYEQKVSDFIESLHDYRSKLREAHRDAKRGKRPLVDVIDITVLDAVYLDLKSGRENAKRQLREKHADYRSIFSALAESLADLSQRLGNCFAILESPGIAGDVKSSGRNMPQLD